MFNYEFDERFAGRYFGKYRGFVVNTEDPKLLGRVKTKVPAVLGNDDELGWALPAPNSGGAANVGDVSIPNVGDLVWIEFEAGDTAYPVWSPGPWALRDGASQVPKHGRGQPDLTDYSVREIDNIPPTQFEGNATDVRIIQGYDGSFLEFDATSGAERVQLSHTTGSRYEISSDGSMQEVCVGNQRRFISGMHSIKSLDEEKEVQGERTVNIRGLATENYLANVIRTYNSVSETGESFGGTWAGDWLVKSGSRFKISSAGNGAISTSNQLALMVGSNLQASVMETIDFTASNTTYGEVPPLAPTPLPSIKFQGYNGPIQFRAADSTGQVKEATLELNPTTLGIGSSTWQVKNILSGIGGHISLDETIAVPGVTNVHLGNGVREPVIKGNAFVTWVKTVLALLASHTHPAPGTASSLQLIEPVTGIIPGSVIVSQLDIPGGIISYTVDVA